MNEADEDLAYPDWCCTVCAAHFKFGKIVMTSRGLRCPECRAYDGL